jgi:peptide/nickel transport system ATP-binding protein
MLFEGRNISFGYDPKHLILNKVNLGIEAGERVGLIGPSGCGKSTLAKILGGYLRSISGEVLFEAKPLPVESYCPVQLIYQHPEKAVNPRWKMGQTLQEAWFTPKNNAADDLFLEEMGIEKEWLERYPIELSGGEIQRFCILRALGPQTKIVLADEMSTMLDVITQAQIWNLMLRVIEKRGLGLLVVTHNQHLAERICSRIIHFESL